jgi:hypothetical protein
VRQLRRSDWKLHHLRGWFSMKMQEKPTAKEEFAIPREVYVCALIEFLTTFGTAITAVPTTRLIEGAVCQRYYGTEFNIAERLCKYEGVQSDLAYLLGGYSSLSSLPNLFLAIPYGILSEHVDRRLILLVNSLSSVLENMFLVIICEYCSQAKSDRLTGYQVQYHTRI